MEHTTQDPPGTEALWTVADVATFLRTTPRRVRALAGTPGFPQPLILGERSWRWDPETIRAWVVTNHAPSAKPRRTESRRELVERV